MVRYVKNASVRLVEYFSVNKYLVQSQTRDFELLDGVITVNAQETIYASHIYVSFP